MSGKPIADGRPPFPANEVQVWATDLVRDEAPFWPLLSLDERVKAERFRFERHRRRFVVARGVLRQLLGSYLAIAPEVVAFTYSDHGKPALDSRHNQFDLQFNMSHSHETAVYAFCVGVPVGIDVEWVQRPLTDAKQIVNRFFSPREAAEWQSLPAEFQMEAFFNGWTRKEAFIKAVGEGLSFPLNEFDVTLRPDEPAFIRQIRGSVEAAANWTLTSFVLDGGYVGATAVAMANGVQRPLTIFKHLTR